MNENDGFSAIYKRKNRYWLVAVIQNLDSTDLYLGLDWFLWIIGLAFFIGLDTGFFIGLDILKV